VLGLLSTALGLRDSIMHELTDFLELIVCVASLPLVVLLARSLGVLPVLRRLLAVHRLNTGSSKRSVGDRGSGSEDPYLSD
jgi:hypothetical protein